MSQLQKMRIFLSSFVLFLFVLSSLHGEEAISIEGPANQMDLLDNERLMGVGDYLVYQVLEERDPGELVFVNDRGQVRIPLLGLVDAKGMTCKAFAFKLKESLEKEFFYRATVLVRFRNADNSRGKVNLVGQITRPGPYDIPADEILTVSGLLVRAGGASAGADLSKVEVVRENPDDPDNPTRVDVNVKEVLEQGNMGADLILRPDDVVVVHENKERTGRYTVTGFVNREGVFDLPLSGTITVSEAVLKAGGFRQYAKEKAVELIRGKTDLPEADQRVVVNVAAILKGSKKEPDPVVKPGDLIYVKEVFFTF